LLKLKALLARRLRLARLLAAEPGASDVVSTQSPHCRGDDDD
jgi:hypothetical protein